jgi:hypothetical protein
MKSFALPAPSAASGPQLFFSAADLPRLRRLFAQDTRFAVMRRQLQEFDRGAEVKFLESEVNCEDQVNDLRRLTDVIQNMAFLHLMTGEAAAGRLALAAVRTLMKFPFWDFFLAGDKVIGVQGAPRCAIAVAVALDWLGDLVDPAERKAWAQAIADKGCEPSWNSLHSIRHPRTARDWTINPRSVVHAQRMGFPVDSSRRPEITKDTNLRAAPAGGLAIGAVAAALYGESCSAAVERWLEMAIHALRVFEEVYLPDGSYGEGVNYANYTSESIFMALVVLRNHGVADLQAGINWRGHINYMLNLAMPLATNPYEVVNIGDSGRHRSAVPFQHPDGRAESRSALPFWVAREYQDGAAQWFGENLAAAHNLWSLIFFDETVAPVAPQNQPQTWYPDLDWVVARTGFRAEDLQVSLRSGIGWNHEHADRNSIIVKAHGEELIVDPCRPPYPFTDPCWMMRTTAGHSAVLIDGHGHFYHNGVEGTCATHAQAHLVGKGEGPGYSYWLSDATQAYRLVDLNIKNVTRAVAVFFDLQMVVVADRVTKWKEASCMEARFFADNWDGQGKIAVGTDGFLIQRPLAQAQARVFSRNGFKLRPGQLPIPAERAAKHPFVAVVTEPAMATTVVTVISVGGADTAAVSTTVDMSGDVIAVTLAQGLAKVGCRIADNTPVMAVNVA